MNLEKIKDNLNDFLKKKNLKLFDLSYQKKDEILSVSIDETLDMDQLEELSNEISLFLDNFENEFEKNYILDVSSVGLERPIRDLDELKNAYGKYIYLKGKDFEYYGTLIDYQDGIIHIECLDKNKKMNVSIDYKKCKKVRYAVKF